MKIDTNPAFHILLNFLVNLLFISKKTYQRQLVPVPKADIIARLRKEIAPLEGLSNAAYDSKPNLHLGPIQSAFPNNQFPLGAVHEFLSHSPEESSATTAFVSSIAGRLMEKGKPLAWISQSATVFPQALKSLGIEPHNVIFLTTKNAKHLLWLTEETLKCENLSAVITEPASLDFTASRRLQLAVESSGVTGFVLRNDTKQISTTACVTRWRIKPLSSSLQQDMPGVGFPKWQVELLKVRNGKPGSWQLEWVNGKLRPITRFSVIHGELQKKAV